jgi:hypothetical protein
MASKDKRERLAQCVSLENTRQGVVFWHRMEKGRRCAVSKNAGRCFLRGCFSIDRKKRAVY